MSKWAIEEKEELGHHNVSETYPPPFPFSCQRDMNLYSMPLSHRRRRRRGGGGGKIHTEMGEGITIQIRGFFRSNKIAFKLF